MKEMMKRAFVWIDAQIGKIDKDFLLHFIVGGGIATIAALCLGLAGVGYIGSAVVGMLCTVTAGTFKEYIIDEGVKDVEASVEDLTTTIAGGLLALVIIGLSVSIW